MQATQTALQRTAEAGVQHRPVLANQDERVQLELLQARTISPQGGPLPGAVARRRLHPPRAVALPSHEGAALSQAAPSARAWGWELEGVGVHRILASKACRRAIMFGDMLDATQCQAPYLPSSPTPVVFSCGHGRPSIAPMLQLPTADSPPRMLVRDRND
ncbi:hypothetical protein EMIHUDRAFT_244503 [Emiliania huxleyi CCMP1516]|uniref:Uncharacterized protein n=2 Tax=Emiliania huxleyi TaxID=2903 RepID=A0A0D3J0P2_EMIH1|nr:hypothetical protein EMIHUDRAFT_244503 [Emiliania huxleyi CCMP1516]EOD17077.1 hypothetical protein EMIHUDRAFT_244503 [Emiliania huxleyi CCMP1516]|eukprot:XP_005769506.1 hypothetical protein EMIHUDRAFT_244503 [Emiliania huxleyi CCMP1516]